MGRVILFLLLIGSILGSGSYELQNRPSALAINARQIELFNSQLDTLHEETAASRSPRGFAWLTLIATVGVPMVLGVILLRRSERSAIHSDEIIRQVVRHGLTAKLIDTERLMDKPQSQVSPGVLRLVRQSPSNRRLGSECPQSDSDEEDDDPSF